MQTNYIKARKSNLFLYQTVPLYYTANGERYGIYKPSGMNLKEMRVKENLIPRELYLKKTDKAKKAIIQKFKIKPQKIGICNHSEEKIIHKDKYGMECKCGHKVAYF